MAFRFEHEETPAEGVKRIATERLEQAIAAATTKPKPSGDDIHDIRRDFKSLRALLQFARGQMVRSAINQENLTLRDAGRALSKARDAQALLGVLQDLFGSSTSTKAGALPPAEQKVIARIRNDLETEAAQSVSDRELKAVTAAMIEMRSRIGHWTFADESGADRMDSFLGTGLERTYRFGRRYLGIVETIGIENATDDLWHEIRKRAKALGYQLRLLRKIWPSVIRAWVEALDELSETLGDDHDLALLHQRILQLPFEASDAEEVVNARQALLRIINRRRNRLKAASFRCAKMIYFEKPGRFANRLTNYWELWKFRTRPETRRNTNSSRPSRSPIYQSRGRG